MQEKLDNETLRLFLNSWPDRALKYLYKFIKPKLLIASEKKTHDAAASKDIVQEAILEIWEKREWILAQPDLIIENYLYAITIFRSINHFKHVHMMRRNARAISLETEPYVDAEEYGKAMEEKDAAIWNVIATFPSRQRECITLKYQHKMSHSQIGRSLGISIKTVDAHIMGAYKRLRDVPDLLT